MKGVGREPQLGPLLCKVELRQDKPLSKESGAIKLSPLYRFMSIVTRDVHLSYRPREVL